MNEPQPEKLPSEETEVLLIKSKDAQSLYNVMQHEENEINVAYPVNDNPRFFRFLSRLIRENKS